VFVTVCTDDVDSVVVICSYGVDVCVCICGVVVGVHVVEGYGCFGRV